MNTLSDEKLRKLDALSDQGGFWYITKQNLVFRDLCFMAKILEAWNDRRDENYQSFFDRHKTLPDYGNLAPLTAHRATKNCEYLGLTKPSDKYSAQSLTPFFFALKDLCKDDFNKISSYPNIVNKQLERIFIDSDINDSYTIQIKICPFMFLFKILLLIGDITESYKIATSEFKLFVATAQSWNDYFEVVESILRYRSDRDFKMQCDANIAKVSDVRYNILAQNHSQLEVTSSDIAIKDGEVKNIRRKVAEYELNDSIQSAEDMFSSSCVSTFPLQQIIYGAPGTGKSHKIKDDEKVKKADEKDLVFRTTFHPDSDYSTFVGCYKPKMKLSTITKDGVTTTEEKIVYKFEPQAFTNAYVNAWNTKEEVYLIIEEINRGNCAQIFGDLFQLLDRKNGISEYPVDADSSLADYLLTALADSKRDDFPTGVKEGKKLVLPSNLYIWATMNTSDQSLFPIDSAFKRRWDWTYMKIKNHPEENYKIKLSDTEYDWWEFLQRINEIIASMTSSADKQLGYFFCKAAGDGTISPETFVSKVIFYLWNDVFKDYGFEDASLFQYMETVDGKEVTKDLTFPDFYDEAGENVNETRLKDFLDKVLNWKKGDNNNNER